MYQAYVKIGCYVETKEEAEQIVEDCKNILPYIDFEDSDIIYEGEYPKVGEVADIVFPTTRRRGR